MATNQKPMPFVSYSQNFEDVMLWRALKSINNGSYIDIGAQHPVVDSVSMAFYERGWRGVHFEPNSQYADELRKVRPDEPVYAEVIGASEGTISFYEIRDTGLSTCDKVLADLYAAKGLRHTVATKKVSTLDSVFDRFGPRDIHWLKIDAEGFEQQVLEGWRNSVARPWIIVVESVCPDSHEDRSREWQGLLIRKDYSPVYFDGLNRYYLHRDHADLAGFFAIPPNVLDNFCLSELSFSFLCQRVRNDWAVRLAEVESQHRNEVKSLREQLISMQNSASWRITTPLRKLHSALKGRRS
jgi:FkbM family methyltransferase